jgi:hypothetical protein
VTSQRHSLETDRPGEIVPDGHAGAIVMRDGQPQSHVNLADPEDLGFEYVQLAATALKAYAAALAPPRTLTHVGGAGLTLPRWAQHRWPGTPQVVLEPDAALTELVRRELPLPRGHRIRVRAVDGRVGVADLATGSASAMFVDAYAAGQVPAELATGAWWADVVRVLVPDGLLLANLADEPDRSWTGRVLGGVHAAGLTEIDLLGTHDVLKGRRFGNLLLVGRRPGVLDHEDLARAVARGALPAGTRRGRPAAYGPAFSDHDAQPSPPPPELGRWRLR